MPTYVNSQNSQSETQAPDAFFFCLLWRYLNIQIQVLDIAKVYQFSMASRWHHHPLVSQSNFGRFCHFLSINYQGSNLAIDKQEEKDQTKEVDIVTTEFGGVEQWRNAAIHERVVGKDNGGMVQRGGGVLKSLSMFLHPKRLANKTESVKKYKKRRERWRRKPKKRQRLHSNVEVEVKNGWCPGAANDSCTFPTRTNDTVFLLSRQVHPKSSIGPPVHDYSSHDTWLHPLQDTSRGHDGLRL